MISARSPVVLCRGGGGRLQRGPGAGPAAPLVEIRTGSTRVAATRGHPFWVNGQGWTMAKHLKAGDILRSVDGAAVIDSIDERPAKEAYNLVVADYGTYFARSEEHTSELQSH